MRHSNLHTHTVFSDGKDTPLALAEKAVENNMVSLGFTDHSEMIFGLGSHKINKFRDYLKNANEVKERMKEKIDIAVGLELDFFSDVPTDEFEYLIGSVHFFPLADGSYHPIDYSEEKLSDYVNLYAKGDALECAKRYYDLVAQNAMKREFLIQGHFDLINKFSFYDDLTEGYEKVALESLDEVLKNVPFIEVNTGAVARGYRTEPYPHDFLLRRILEKGGRVVINGDTHDGQYLLCHYEESLEKLKKIGFSEIWQRRDGKMCPVAL